MKDLEDRNFFFSFIFISWRLITLQHCSGFCHTLKWISHGFTCIPHPGPPSHLPLYPIPLGLPSAPGLSTCLMQRIGTLKNLARGEKRKKNLKRAKKAYMIYRTALNEQISESLEFQKEVWGKWNFIKRNNSWELP